MILDEIQQYRFTSPIAGHIDNHLSRHRPFPVGDGIYHALHDDESVTNPRTYIIQDSNTLFSASPSAGRNERNTSDLL